MTFNNNALHRASVGDILKDNVVQGLQFRRGKTKASFYLYHRDHNGEQRRPAIGTFPVMDVMGARNRAIAMLREVAMAEFKPRPTELHKVMQDYLDTDGRLIKPATMKQYMGIWENHVEPALGGRDINKISYDCWQKLHDVMPVVLANRMKAFMMNLYKVAKKKGYYAGEPPITLVRNNKEKARTRVMSPPEVQRFVDTASAWWEKSTSINHQRFACLTMMYLHTSCRKDELLNLRWKNINWDTGCLELPDSKTGQKTVPLTEQAISWLLRIRSIVKPTQEEFNVVFPLGSSVAPLWLRFKKDAELMDLNLHDIRRSAASIGFRSGMELSQIGQVLGHSSVKSTEKYSYLDTETKKKYAQKVSTAIDDVIAGEV